MGLMQQGCQREMDRKWEGMEIFLKGNLLLRITSSMQMGGYVTMPCMCIDYMAKLQTDYIGGKLWSV